MAQWHPLCRWRSHFPREFHAFRLYCIDFHAWNSLILKDNIMDAIWCKEWPIFSTRSTVGYSGTACPRTNRPNGRSLSPSPASSSIIAVPDGWGEVTWPSLFLHGVRVTLQWVPVSGDSRKMDGAEDSGMGSLLETGAFTSRSRWDCVAVYQHSVAPDTEVISVSASTEWCKKKKKEKKVGRRRPVYWSGSVLVAPRDMELINGNDNERSLGSTVWGLGHSMGEARCTAWEQHRESEINTNR